MYSVRNADATEFERIGKLMIKVYSSLEGFPTEQEQPDYYRMLATVGDFTGKPGTEILVAETDNNEIVGAVVFFDDMRHYGSGGTATGETNAAGFRLLAVDENVRGKGVGKLLTAACIEKARAKKRQQVIIHTTKSMQPAWRMYEQFGFKRSEDLDFKQGELAVFGFRLLL